MLAPTRRVAVLALTATIVATMATACSSSKSSPAATSSAAAGGSSTTSAAATATSSAASGVSGTVTVFAAASLTEAFTTLGKQFEAANPGTTVKFSFGGSSALALQINSGAPADVFASASTKNMTQVTSKGNADAPKDFATNTMEIAVPPSNPAKITSLADLAKSGVKVALCQVAVPCGAAAATVLKNANLSVTPATLEEDVKSVLTKVELNEVDAGIVYVSDVKTAGSKVTGVLIPTGANTTTKYPIATLKASKNPPAAAAFEAFVLSPAGTAALAADGFAAP